MIAIPRHGVPPARAADAGARCPVAGSWWVSLGVSIVKSLRYAAGGHIGRPGDSVAPPQGPPPGRPGPSFPRAAEPAAHPPGGIRQPDGLIPLLAPFHIQTGPFISKRARSARLPGLSGVPDQLVQRRRA